MAIVSLNIGPSHVSDAVKADIREITDSGLLSESHRGETVRNVLRSTDQAFHDALAVPEDCAVVFQPSATAAMELVLRNLVRERSYHFVHGSFGGRFAATAGQVGVDAERNECAWDKTPAPADARIREDCELITVTHNETSTGRMWPAEELRALRVSHPGPLIAVDATSSLGAFALDWSLADVWIGSVQKCLGLPAGLGFAVAGPRALERARQLGTERRVAAWQDLLAMAEQMKTGETLETPNVLAVELLGRQLRRWDLARVEEECREKARRVWEVIGEERLFIPDPAWRSLTTHCVLADDAGAWKQRALEAGYEIGSGYGPLRQRCVRIATFPSVTLDQVEQALAAVTGGS